MNSLFAYPGKLQAGAQDEGVSVWLLHLKCTSWAKAGFAGIVIVSGE